MNKELYHGTSSHRIVDFLETKQDFFGVRHKKDPSMSATLTDDKYYAITHARGVATLDEQSQPIILTFSIPNKEVAWEGTVGAGHVTEGFSTKHLVKDPRQLPPGFLRNLGITVEEAIEQYAKRKVEYYRIPREYFYAHGHP